MIVLGERSVQAALDSIGLQDALRAGGTALVKINLARPPEPGHPRTDAQLLMEVVRYIARHGAHCAVAEGANGYLRQNIESVGLGRVVYEHDVSVIDLDTVDYDCVSVNDEETICRGA